jgi:small subunit ribosomal protein S18
MTTRGRPGGSGGGRFGPRRGRPRYFPRRKVCSFCVDHVKHIDYKDVPTIRRFISDQAKIESRRKSGVCSRHQRALASAIKRARHLAMVPLSATHRARGMGFGR